MLLVLLNKFSMNDEGKPNYEHFSVTTTPVTNKTFQQVFLHALQFNALNNRVEKEIIDENFVFQIMDKAMQQCTMYDFCRAIELFFADLFHCERVNVILCHRFKKYLFRIEPDPKTGTHRLRKFELASGIAGYVAISS